MLCSDLALQHMLLVDGTARITGPAGGTENPDLIKCDELTGLPEVLDQLATLRTLNLSGVVELPGSHHSSSRFPVGLRGWRRGISAGVAR